MIVQAASDRSHGDGWPVLWRRDSGVAVASCAQERLWFLDKLHPGRSDYVVSSAFRVTGPLDHRAFVEAVSVLVNSHSVLRAVFEEQGGRAVQRVMDAGTAEVEWSEVSVLGESGFEVAREECRRFVERPFDLATGPLVRVGGWCVGPEQHFVGFAFHHAIFDAKSAELVFKELSGAYTASLGGRAIDPVEGLEYGDYAAWQRECLDGGFLEGEREYWRGVLAGVEPLELPLDHRRPAVGSARGGVVRFDLSDEVARQLRSVASECGSTLFMALLAAFAVVLGRYSGQEDVAIGTPVSGRTRTEFEDIVGLFVNTVVLRCDTSGDPTFAELLSRVRDVTLGALDHQEVPFEKVVEDLRPDRDLSRNPLVQVWIALAGDTGQTPLRLDGTTVKEEENGSPGALFDLSLFLAPGRDGVACSLVYSTDLFERETVEGFGRYLEEVVRSAAAAPGRRLSELSGEGLAPVFVGPTAESGAGDDWLVADRVVEQARACPDGAAVRCGDEMITYGELDERSGQLASYLRRSGVGSETRVGVCLERSVDLAVALLAIWRRGACYVPLDPTYPVERLQFMIADAAVDCVLTAEPLAGRCRGAPALISLDTEASHVAACTDAAIAPGGRPHLGLRRHASLEECEALAPNTPVFRITRPHKAQPRSG